MLQWYLSSDKYPLNQHEDLIKQWLTTGTLPGQNQDYRNGGCTCIDDIQCSCVYPIWVIIFLIGECMTVVNRTSSSFLPIHIILCRNRYSINPDCKCLPFCFLLICFHSSCQDSWLLFKFWTEILSISKEDIPVNIILNGSGSWFRFYLSFQCFALLEIERTVPACQCYLI